MRNILTLCAIFMLICRPLAASESFHYSGERSVEGIGQIYATIVAPVSVEAIPLTNQKRMDKLLFKGPRGQLVTVSIPNNSAKNNQAQKNIRTFALNHHSGEGVMPVAEVLRAISSTPAEIKKRGYVEVQTSY